MLRQHTSRSQCKQASSTKLGATRYVMGHEMVQLVIGVHSDTSNSNSQRKHELLVWVTTWRTKTGYYQITSRVLDGIFKSKKRQSSHDEMVIIINFIMLPIKLVHDTRDFTNVSVCYRNQYTFCSLFYLSFKRITYVNY